MSVGNARSVLKSIADVTFADRLRIYIDTSVLGGCFDPEFATWANSLVRGFLTGGLIASAVKRRALQWTWAEAIGRNPRRYTGRGSGCR